MTKPKPHSDQPRLERAISNAIKPHVGSGSAVTGADFTSHLKFMGFRSLTQRQLRIAIRDMRRKGIPICSKAGKGYFWPESLEEVQACQAVEFESKAKDMLATGKAMMDGAIALFGNQRRLGL